MLRSVWNQCEGCAYAYSRFRPAKLHSSYGVVNVDARFEFDSLLHQHKWRLYKILSTHYGAQCVWTICCFGVSKRVIS
jgi:hypothetical protein